MTNTPTEAARAAKPKIDPMIPAHLGLLVLPAVGVAIGLWGAWQRPWTPGDLFSVAAWVALTATWGMFNSLVLHLLPADTGRARWQPLVVLAAGIATINLVLIVVLNYKAFNWMRQQYLTATPYGVPAETGAGPGVGHRADTTSQSAGARPRVR